MTHDSWQARPTNAINKFPSDNLWIRLKGHGLPGHILHSSVKGPKMSYQHLHMPSQSLEVSKRLIVITYRCHEKLHLVFDRKRPSPCEQGKCGECPTSSEELHQPFEEHLNDLILDAWTLKRDHKSSNRVIPKVTLSSPCLSASFHPLSPLSVVSTEQRYFNKSQYEMLYSAFRAQVSRLYTVVAQLWAVKIYLAAVEAFRKKERQDETQITTKTDGFLSFIPCWTLIYFFAGFFLISPCVWPNTGFWCCVFSHFRDNSNSGQGLWKFRIAGKFVAEAEELIFYGNALE